MDKIDIAVIGTGGMAASHLANISGNPQLRLTAICDVDQHRADEVGEKQGVPAFYDYHRLFETARPQAVLIATPHFFHPPIAIEAFRHGVHVLVEKPIAVHAKEASRMIAAYEKARNDHPDLVFAAMFMYRTYGQWRKLKEMIDEGMLGRLIRATWVVTDWFRTQIYYDTGGWRATWKGEGGGVLLNQCPHNLDLYQWLFGMPERVRGTASLGKYHAIEVEDEVTAVFEHRSGMIGHFITSTAESPGTNRLEIVGEHGRAVVENGEISFDRNEISMLEAIRTSKERFTKVPFKRTAVTYEHHGEPGHRQVLENFVSAIQSGEALTAPGVEGLASVSLGNAILMSALRDETVAIPLDEEAFAELLEELIAKSQKSRQT